MALRISDYEELINGGPPNDIRNVLEEALTKANEDKSRLKVYIRMQDKGTAGMTKVGEFRIEPSTAQVDDVKSMLIKKLADAPGLEFSGKIRIEFQNSSNSSLYGSYQRTVSIGTLANFEDVPPDEFYDGNNASVLEGQQSEISSDDRDRLIAHYEKLLAHKDRDIAQLRAGQDAAMAFLFKGQAQMHAMFERSTRMMENYTLRFGFPTPHPGIMDVHGSGNQEPIAPKQDSGAAMGLLGPLLQLAGKLAAGGGGAEPPRAITQQAPPSQNRMARVVSGSAAVQSMRPPQIAQPARGVTPPPPMPSDRGQSNMSMGEDDPEIMEMERRSRAHRHQEPEDDAAEYESYGGQGGDGSDDGEEGGDALSQFNNLDPQSVKQLVVGWIRAKPENKQAAMSLGSDLMGEIMG